jgi:hypothetical protein
MDTQKASQELRDLVLALDKVNDVLKEKQEAYDEVYEQWRVWSKTNPEPRRYVPRQYRKWSNRQDKFMAAVGFYEARDAQMDAAKVQREARIAVAEFKSRDLNDVALKSAAALVYEGTTKANGVIICQGITIDMLRMAAVN